MMKLKLQLPDKVNQNDLFTVLKHGMAFREYNPEHSVDDKIIHESKTAKDVKDGEIKEGIDTTKKAEDLRREYTDNYVTSMNLHSLYIIDSKICQVEQRYVYQLVRMAFPKRNQMLCSTSYANGKLDVSPINLVDSYKKYKDEDMILRILERRGTQFAILGSEEIDNQ